MLKKLVIIYVSFYLITSGIVPIASVYAQDNKVYTLAAITFDAKGVSEIEAEVLSEKLRSHISQLVNSPEYKALTDRDQYLIVEQTQIDKILEQFETQNIGCVSDSCAIEFGKMLQVDRIVIGQIGLVGSTYLVSARIIDVESRKAVASSSHEYKGAIDEVISTVILEVGNELFMGKKKKSRKLWYLVGGAVIVGAGAAAALGGGSEEGGEIPVILPGPPGRP